MKWASLWISNKIVCVTEIKKKQTNLILTK